jgi:hypothetical protein
MHWVINSYSGNTEWIKEYTDSVTFYDKKNLNVGYNIWDYMDYIVKNYENLPDRILFGKDNMLERHITKEEFDECLKKEGLVPLLTQNHETKNGICYYQDGLYYEINNRWYINQYEIKDRESFEELVDFIGIRGEKYLGFAPGACYIVPRENILKHPKEFYQKLKDSVSYTQLPAEAHLIERSLYFIWQ